MEERVNTEATAFLERKYEKLQQQTEYWDTKWEMDTEEKEKEIQDLKGKKAADLMKLMELKQKYKEVNDALLKEKRLREAKQFAKEMSTKRTEAAKVIQNAFRQFKKMKQVRKDLLSLLKCRPRKSTRSSRRLKLKAKRKEKERNHQNHLQKPKLSVVY